MARFFIVRSGGTEVGPLSIENLRSLLLSGKISRRTNIRAQDSTTVVPAGRLRALFPAKDESLVPVDSILEEQDRSRRPWLWIVGAAAVLLVSAGLVWCGGMLHVQNARRQPARPAQREDAAVPAAEQPLQTTQQEIFAAYDANAIDADRFYQGRLLRVTGPIATINSDILGTPYLTLQTDGIFSVQCMFDDDSALRGRRAGETVTVVGRCDGKMGNVLIADCRIE